MKSETLNKMQDVINAYNNAKGYIYQAIVNEFDNINHILIFKVNIHTLRPSEMKKFIKIEGKYEKVTKYGNKYFEFYFDSQEEFNKIFNEVKKELKVKIFKYNGDFKEKIYNEDEEIKIF